MEKNIDAEKSRNCYYDVVDVVKNRIVETLSNKEVYNLYGIKNVSKYLLKNSNPKLPNGNLLLEHEDGKPCREIFYRNSNYQCYYDYQKEKFMVHDKNNGDRIDLEVYLENGRGYFILDNISYLLDEKFTKLLLNDIEIEI